MTEPPPLPAQPELSPIAARLSEASRQAFRYANRACVVPWHRAGLSAWLGNPLTGCQLLLTTTGRRSGVPRHAPLGYIVMDGAAWVMAGYGTSTQWYRNLQADPNVQLLLPGRPPIAAVADEVRDRQVRATIIPRLARSMPLPGLTIGCNPATASDERILALTAWVPLIRIAPVESPLVAGPDDPGGSGWIWRQLVVTTVTVMTISLVGRARR